MLESIIATAIGSFIGFTICYFVWYRNIYVSLKDTDTTALKVDTYDGKLKVTTNNGTTFEFPNWFTLFITKAVLLRKTNTMSIGLSTETIALLKEKLNGQQ